MPKLGLIFTLCCLTSYLATANVSAANFDYRVYLSSGEIAEILRRNQINIVTEDGATRYEVHLSPIKTLEPGLIHVNHNVTTIELKTCEIEEIQAGAFVFENAILDELIINNNSIPKITAGIFNHLPIKYLELSENKILTIDSDALNNMTLLRQLNLRHNLLAKIDPSWFIGCDQLYILDLHNNFITDLTHDVFQTLTQRSNVSLFLSGNHLKTIHEDILKGFHDLKRLDLSDNKIEEVSPEVFANKTIASVDLTNNNLSCIPETLYKQEQMEWFSIMYNPNFRCDCLRKIEKFVTRTTVYYPAIICEDPTNLTQIVYNENRTIYLPLLFDPIFQGVPRGSGGTNLTNT